MAPRQHVKTVRAEHDEQMGKISMEEELPETVIPSRQQPRDFAKLLCKLRWIGMDEEAFRLQLAVRCLPLEQRGIVWPGPFSTD